MSEHESIPPVSAAVDKLLEDGPASHDSLSDVYEKATTLALLYGTAESEELFGKKCECWHAVFNLSELTTVCVTKYEKPFNEYGLSSEFLTGHVQVFIKDGPVIDKHQWRFDDTKVPMQVKIDHSRFIPHTLEEAQRLIRLELTPPDELAPEDLVILSYHSGKAEENLAKDEGLGEPSENQTQYLLMLLNALDPGMLKAV